MQRRCLRSRRCDHGELGRLTLEPGRKGSVSFGNNLSLIRIPTITMSPKLMAHIFHDEISSGGFSTRRRPQPFESFALTPEKRIGGSVAVKNDNRLHAERHRVSRVRSCVEE